MQRVMFFVSAPRDAGAEDRTSDSVLSTKAESAAKTADNPTSARDARHIEQRVATSSANVSTSGMRIGNPVHSKTFESPRRRYVLPLRV